MPALVAVDQSVARTPALPLALRLGDVIRPAVAKAVYQGIRWERQMDFLRLWVISALAALCTILVVLSAWLFVHLRFDTDETLDAMLTSIANARLVLLLVVISALVGLIEAAIVKFWRRRGSRRA
jgi:hypothetical protein